MVAERYDNVDAQIRWDKDIHHAELSSTRYGIGFYEVNRKDGLKGDEVVHARHRSIVYVAFQVQSE